MSTTDKLELLRSLADQPSEVLRDGDRLLLSRHGREYELLLRDVAGVGIAIQTDDEGFEPVEIFCQKALLNLQNLAKQICLSLESEKKDWPGGFVESSAQFSDGKTTHAWETVSLSLDEYLNAPLVGSTTLVELMARAGQGKTVLLNEIALRAARRYSPAVSPAPIILPVDLLGRFVGSIDDAIAGELSNRYLCPGLTQRDIVQCLRRRWLILALDGFDELAARIGIREAFLRLGELGDQLGGEGTVILAARDSFFELFQVNNAIAKHLQPRTGSYVRVALSLSSWQEEQGVEVFRNLGADNPQEHLKNLRLAFQGDSELVFHPFFLTRLAKLWNQGDRFETTGATGRLERTKFVVEIFVERETEEKWTDRAEGGALLKKEEHAFPLGAVAEEMWRSSVSLMDEEEIRLAGEVGLLELNISRVTKNEVLERLPTHCALVVGRGTVSRRYTFIHQRFFFYFLAHRLSLLIQRRQIDPVRQALGAGILDPEVVEWISWFLAGSGQASELVEFLSSNLTDGVDESVRGNVGSIVAKIIDRSAVGAVGLSGLVFIGEAWRSGTAVEVRFAKCDFWETSFEGAEFQECVFEECQISSIRVDRQTRFRQSIFRECEIGSVSGGRWGIRFAPQEIEEVLKAHGASVERAIGENRRPDAGVSREFLACTEEIVRRSIRSTDQEVGELEESIGRIVKSVVRLGVEAGTMSFVEKSHSGRNKKFIRFQVDREELLEGQVVSKANESIDRFWRLAREKHPA